MKYLISVLLFFYINNLYAQRVSGINVSNTNRLACPDVSLYKWYKPPVYIMALMAADLGFLLVTGMADDKMRYSNFRKAFTMPPVFDDDAFWINYISHPVMGSESYLRARESNYGWFGSFLFSTGMSLTWEYLIESWTERPSINDMMVTSTIGSLIGELRYWGKSKMNPKYHWFVDPINTLVIQICPKQKSTTISLSIYLP